MISSPFYSVSTSTPFCWLDFSTFRLVSNLFVWLDFFIWLWDRLFFWRVWGSFRDSFLFFIITIPSIWDVLPLVFRLSSLRLFRIGSCIHSRQCWTRGVLIVGGSLLNALFIFGGRAGFVYIFASPCPLLRGFSDGLFKPPCTYLTPRISFCSLRGVWGTRWGCSWLCFWIMWDVLVDASGQLCLVEEC